VVSAIIITKSHLGLSIAATDGMLLPYLPFHSQGPLYMDMVLMGFPNKKQSELPSLAFDGTSEPKLKKVAFICPRCENRVTDLPITCNVCNLPLVSAKILSPPLCLILPDHGGVWCRCQSCSSHTGWCIWIGIGFEVIIIVISKKGMRLFF